MSKLTIPQKYSSQVDPNQTELGIKFIKVDTWPQY